VCDACPTAERKLLGREIAKNLKVALGFPHAGSSQFWHELKQSGTTANQRWSGLIQAAGLSVFSAEVNALIPLLNPTNPSGFIAEGNCTAHQFRTSMSIPARIRQFLDRNPL
jgi:hypothetical protein